MQKIYISSWLNEQGSAIQFVPNLGDVLELDFSNVDELSMKDIETILALQKLAVFNEVKLHVENMKPAISRIFEQTGLYKMLGVFDNNSIFKIKKRQGLAFD